MKRALLIAFCPIWCFHVQVVWGELDINRPFPSTFDMGNWSGQGNVSVTGQGCIRSYTLRWFFPSARDYQVRVDTDSAGGLFLLRHENDPSNTIPFSVELTDLISGNSQPLTPSIFSNDVAYQTYWCDDGYDAELGITILQSDLYQVPAGRYRVWMDVDARRSDAPGETDTQTAILAEINVDDLVRISNLDNISIAYDGVATSVGYNESYCVYANTGDYTITPSSTPGSSPSSYGLNNGIHQVEYTVLVSNTDDASSGIPLDNGQTSPALAANQSTPLSINCSSGGDNAAVYVEIPGSQLQAVPAGTYSGTLTLQVAPI